MKSGFALAWLVATASLTTPLQADEEHFDPNSIDIVDAIECRLDARAYTGFALALNAKAPWNVGFRLQSSSWLFLIVEVTKARNFGEECFSA
jgi:hypothetical protein